MRYLEATTAQARAKRGGKSAIETTANWVIARFTHDTSRELDPQLHTHAVVINATRRDDGAWRTLSSREMFRAKMTGGAIYRAELASALQRLGYQVEVTHSDGRFEVKGFSPGQLRHFSRRREEIEAALKELGASGAKASATLALYTRARKGPIDRDELNKDWKVRADAQGLRFERPKPGKVPKPHRQLVKLARDAVDWAIAHLTERESVINHRDVVRHSLEYGTGHVTLSSVAATIAELAKGASSHPDSASALYHHGSPFNGARNDSHGPALAGQGAADRLGEGGAIGRTQARSGQGSNGGRDPDPDHVVSIYSVDGKREVSGKCAGIGN